MLLAMKSNHGIVDSQQDFNVVAVLPSFPAAAAAAQYSLIDLPGY